MKLRQVLLHTVGLLALAALVAFTVIGLGVELDLGQSPSHAPTAWGRPVSPELARLVRLKGEPYLCPARITGGCLGIISLLWVLRLSQRPKKARPSDEALPG